MMRSPLIKIAAALLAWALAPAEACPCCPMCMPVYCPCACQTCGNVPTVPPPTEVTCRCPNGMPATGANCPQNGAFGCVACKEGFTLVGKTCQAITTPAPPKVCVCLGGTAATGANCPANGATACVACNADLILVNGVCKPKPTPEPPVTPPPKECICPGGTAAFGPQCPQNGATVCTACNEGFIMVNGQCKVKPTPPPEKVCVCPNGMPATGVNCPQNGATVCASCNNGFQLVGQICEAVTTPAPKVCRCPNGMPATGPNCPQNGALVCTGCNDGFQLVGQSCEAVTTPAPKVCRCPNGMPASGPNCPQNGALVCTDCNDGFELVGQSCEAKTTPPPPKACRCPNGKPAVGPNCPQDNALVCSSCDDGYSLVGETCEMVTPAPTPAPTPPPGPLFKCDLNCYGDSSIPVPLPGGNGNGVKADTVEVCRDYCMATNGCEGIVYGQGMCYGKKDIRTSKCQIGGGYETEMLTKMPFGTCTLLGDPHVLCFDNPNGHAGDLLQLVHGDYWLLKSDNLQIQARFGYSSRFPAEASTTGIAIAGSLIQNHHLVVEYTGPAKGYGGFKAFWDGQQILNSGFPATYSANGVLQAKLDNLDPQEFHDQARHTIGGTEGDKPSFLFEIVPDIRIYLLIGEETVNAVVTLRRPAGHIDGYCGTFNCDPADDSLEELNARGLGQPITGKTLFDGAPPAPHSQTVRGDGEVLHGLEDCDPDLLTKAEAACKDIPDATREACKFDVCASGDVAVAQDDAVTSAVSQNEMTQHFALFGMTIPPPFGAAIPAQVQWGFVGMVCAMLVGGTVMGWVSNKVKSSRAPSFLRVASDDHDDDEEALLPDAATEYDPIEC